MDVNGARFFCCHYFSNIILLRSSAFAGCAIAKDVAFEHDDSHCTASLIS
jgi:hypothetical protein